MKTLAQVDDAEEIRRRLQSLTGDETAVWGKMSVGEMVCHVRECFRVAVGDVTVAPLKLPIPAATIKWMALRTPFEWKKNIQTVPELLPGREGTTPGDFGSDLHGAIAEFERMLLAMPEHPHAFFGPMTTADWMRWGYLHTDHHLRQFGR